MDDVNLYTYTKVKSNTIIVLGIIIVTISAAIIRTPKRPTRKPGKEIKVTQVYLPDSTSIQISGVLQIRGLRGAKLKYGNDTLTVFLRSSGFVVFKVSGGDELVKISDGK